MNPSPPAIMKALFMIEVSLHYFNAGQDSEGHGKQMRFPEQAEAFWQCSPYGHQTHFMVNKKISGIQSVSIHLLQLNIKPDPMPSSRICLPF